MSNLIQFNQTITNPKTAEYLAKVLGEKKASFVNNLTALVANSKNLQECEPVSLMYAGIKATALDLPLDANLGFAYVIPYKNTKEKRTDAQFQIGYKGFIQLAMRSGQFKTINVREVRDGEIVKENFVSGEIEFKRLDENREEAKVIGYVAFFSLINGFEKMSYWSIAEIEKHGKRFSQTFKNGFGLWKDDFDSMARKTVLKLLLSKYAPMSVEMKAGLKDDQIVVTPQGEEIYLDNVQVVEAQEIQEAQNEKVAAMFGQAFENENQQTEN